MQSHDASRSLSRRDVLRQGLAGTGALVGSSWLIACGDDEAATTGGGNGGGSADIGKPLTSGPLPPFDPNAKAGAKSDLPKRIAYAVDNDREYQQASMAGVEAGAKAGGIEFLSANANGDSAKNISQIQQFMARGIGALVIAPIDAKAQEPVIREALDKGIAVSSIFPPATMALNAAQFKVGKALGDEAATHIKTKLGGKARVVILNQDSVEPVRPRFEAMREAVKAAGGTIVADVEPSETDKEGGFATMSTILQKNPDVDVVLGADSVSLGALAALKAKNKAHPDMFIGGIDGEKEALASIQEPNSAYKVSVAFGTQVFNFPLGFYAAEWIAGKSIPQAVEVRALPLNSPTAISDYLADMEDPTKTWNDPARRDKYIALYGNITWEKRGQYVDFQWTP